MMAATARRRDPDDDIAAIAKQISEQAEAIYQNWKARGLAPGELINCHAAGDASRLDSMLKPQQASTKPTIDLLAQAPTMDNNRLEKLVKNFVVEDKARLAARGKTMASSIQYALQKFERTAQAQQQQQQQQHHHQQQQQQPDETFVRRLPTRANHFSAVPTPATPASPPPPANEIADLQTPIIKPALVKKPHKARIPEAVQAPFTDNHHGLQTWPLKNKIISTETVKKTTAEVKPITSPFHPIAKTTTTTVSSAAITTTNNNTNGSSNAYIDEVALEEKRLINALKNGVVISEEAAQPSPLTAIVPKVVAKEPEGTRWGLKNVKQQVPHPELTTTQKQHIRLTASNPVRPFLTKGSVAERVLIFERCPSDLLLDKRARGPALQTVKTVVPPKQQPHQHTTLQRHVRANRNVHIPRFHYPLGKPTPPAQLESLKQRVCAVFAQIGERASREHFAQLTRACHLPLYWKTPLYLAVCGDKSTCTLDHFMTFWDAMAQSCHDAAARFIHVLTRGRRTWLGPEDFIPLVQDVVETHPGLTFLKEATEFHSRYVHTVIARIFYCVNRSWSGRISIAELRRANLLTIIQLLEEEEDINQITAYFSYEHFYVIYCKFWELDRDHDLYIDKQDLARHSDHALSTRIIDRIFSGCVTRGDEKMSYTEFVWFLLSEEDKTHATAIEYWFRCMDIDGDGYLSMYELEFFYEEQMHRMESIGIETLPFLDCLCQMLDMVKPKVPGKIALSDLKKCKMTPIFFDTFFNLEKYLDHEQRDPFASRDHDLDGREMSDWDRYAAEEYELLVAEEGNDQQDSLSYDEGTEDLDVVLDISDAPCGLSDDSDECSI